MTELSPPAQAVLSAYEFQALEVPPRLALAASLRSIGTASEEIEIPFALIDEWEQIEGVCASFHAAAEWGHKQALAKLLAIAAELEEAANE